MLLKINANFTMRFHYFSKSVSTLLCVFECQDAQVQHCRTKFSDISTLRLENIENCCDSHAPQEAVHSAPLRNHTEQFCSFLVGGGATGQCGNMAMWEYQ